MTPNSMNELRRQLEERREALRRRVKTEEVELRENREARAGVPMDQGEMAADEGRDGVHGGVDQAARDEIERIDSALDRMDRGAYTECEECGHEIEPERLEAQPVATRCIGCAEVEDERRLPREERPSL